MIRVVSVQKNAATAAFTQLTLDAQSRHVRRKVFALESGDSMLVDFALAIMLEHGDHLILDDGRSVAVIAAHEDLMAVRGRDAAHLTKLTWHIGNRHLDAQIEPGRLLLRRDKVIALMLEHQGATVKDVHEPFAPERGAYDAH